MKHLTATLLLLTACNQWTVQDVIPSDKNCGYVLVKGNQTKLITGQCLFNKGDKIKPNKFAH